MEKTNGKNIIVGIAGHVGHGKTTFAELLTGIKQEPEPLDKILQRTVESIILPLGLHEDFSVTIIDVPGHGRYLKNTIRGLSGVDMAILVVAADDGVMPRTVEHIQILEFLGVKHGFVVLSKCDLVDEETISLAKLDIEDAVQGSFLEKSPIIPFSAGNKKQLNKAIDQLEKEAQKLAGKNPAGPFRLWVDRICSFTGHGTVVCGTVQKGQIQEGDPLELFPGGVQSRARTLEVHRQKVSSAVAGQQLGINLPKIPVKTVARGMMLSAPGSIRPCHYLNVKFRLSKTTLKPLVNHQKVLVYLGTGIALAQVVIMDTGEIKPGDFALVQLRLKTPLPASAGDHVVITSHCEKIVMGGGDVLEASLFKFRRSKAGHSIGYLNALIKRDLPEVIRHYMHFFPHQPVTADKIAGYTGIELSAINTTINQMVSSKDILPIGDRKFYLTEEFKSLKGYLLNCTAELLETDLIKESVNIEELRNRSRKNIDKHLLQKAVESLCRENKLIKEAAGFRLPRRTVKLNSAQNNLVEQIFQCADKMGIMPFSAAQLFEKFDRKYSKREFQKMLTFLTRQGKLVQLSDDRFLTAEAIEKVKQRIQKIVLQKNSFTLSDCTQILGFGRSKGAPIFDYLDSVGFTKRDGNLRTLR